MYNLKCVFVYTSRIPVAALSKAWVCGRSLAGIKGPNPAIEMDICLLWALCVVRQRAMRQAAYSFTGVKAGVVCSNSVIAKPHQEKPWSEKGSKRHRKKIIYTSCAIKKFW